MPETRLLRGGNFIALLVAVSFGIGVAAAYIHYGPRALIALVGLLIWPGWPLFQSLLVMSSSITFSPATLSFDDSLSRISAAPTDRTQEVAAAQIALLTDYYKTVLAQARESFRWALIGVAVGLVFFIVAIAVQLAEGATDAATISAISGGLVEVISGINFVLYGKTTAQLAHFHERLDRTQRFLLANSLCEAVVGVKGKDEARRALITVIAALPSDSAEPEP